MEHSTTFLLLIFCFNICTAIIAPLKILNDGHKIPSLGLGTFSEKPDIPKTRQSVLWALESGYRHIDTASVYGNEEYVGLGIADAIAKGIVKREDVFVTTKLWNDRHATEEVVKSLRESLKRLGLDYVDLYLVHFPIALKANGSLDYIDYLDTWKGMEEAKRLGLAKSIGVSNFNAKQIDRIIDNGNIRPAVNEIEVHPTLTQVPLVEHCQKLGIVVMAYSPFGFVVNRNNKKALPPKSDDPTLLKIAAKYGKNTGQVVLRYLIDRDLIPIPKSSKKERIEQNINVFDFELTNEEINEINQFNKNTSVFGENEEWKAHPYYPF